MLLVISRNYSWIAENQFWFNFIVQKNDNLFLALLIAQSEYVCVDKTIMYALKGSVHYRVPYGCAIKKCAWF